MEQDELELIQRLQNTQLLQKTAYEELENALDRAWHEGPDASLASHVRANFLWTDVARRTAEVYDRVAR